MALPEGLRDTLFVGTILTMDEARPRAEALLVRGGGSPRSARSPRSRRSPPPEPSASSCLGARCCPGFTTRTCTSRSTASTSTAST